MLDGARIFDTSWCNSRTATPSLQLGVTLARYLRRQRPHGGVADSTPLALLPSARSIPPPHRPCARHAAVLRRCAGRVDRPGSGEARAKPASFQGAASAVLAAVAADGTPHHRCQSCTSTSGLSTYDRLTASTVAETLRPHTRVDKSAGNGHHRGQPASCRAGRSPPLPLRRADAAARGHIRAKTGSLNNVSTLAGMSTAPYKRPLLLRLPRQQHRLLARRQAWSITWPPLSTAQAANHV
ncbi:MAG: D-alanyl-D-alanine carboxypeptidase [Lawsonella clevelandensis]